MPPLRLKRYLLTGLLTFIPLWVTWLVFKFVLGVLAGIGAPLVAALLNRQVHLVAGALLEGEVTHVADNAHHAPYC